MMQHGGRLTRRDLFKTGTAIAGAAWLQSSAGGLAAGEAPAEVVGPAEGESGAVSLPSAAKPSVATPAPSPFPTALQPSKLKRPNILLIVMDTVRADHLSCYGHHRETTPNIDAFAAGARLYKNVLSPDCFTVPSHASFFTGLSSTAHGANNLHLYMDDRLETLAEQLQAAGYQTVGLASNGFYVCRASGFDKGFGDFWNPSSEDPKPWTNDVARATAMHAALGQWLSRKYDPQKPFFLFLNYIEAHEPYRPPPELLQFTARETWNRWRARDVASYVFDHMLTGADILSPQDIAELESLYDDAIRYIDLKIGEVLSFLKSTGLDETTAVFITSDHGEHFGEHHLMEHHYALYEPLVRVPLIVRCAGRLNAGEEPLLVQSHDIYATILELAEVAWQRKPGQTCASLFQPPSEARYGISEYVEPWGYNLAQAALTYRKVDFSRFNRRLRAIQRGNMKLIRPSRGELELYDLAADPTETRNLAQQEPDLTRELAGTLDTWIRSFAHYVPVPVRPDMPQQTISEEELNWGRGLGYIH